jgi:4-hydroxybenzoate polyprenyltransferase
MRIHSAASESLLILLGALVMGQHSLLLLAVLFAIGIFFHIDGFISNEYADIEVDRLSPDIQHKPLLRGDISKTHAMIVAWTSCIIVYLLTFIFFFSLLPILFLTSSILLGTAYNFYRKKIQNISDFAIAGSLAFLALYGASTVSPHLTLLSYIISGLIFFGIVFANVVESGLKDVDHDALGGRKTLATVMGVNVHDKSLHITKTFIGFAVSLIAVCYVLLIFLGFQPEIHFWSSGIFSYGVTIGLSIIILIGTYQLLRLRVFDRPKIKRLYVIIDTAAGALLLIMLLPFLGVETVVVLLIIPISWFIGFNLLLYGKPLQPEV